VTNQPDGERPRASEEKVLTLVGLVLGVVGATPVIVDLESGVARWVAVLIAVVLAVLFLRGLRLWSRKQLDPFLAVLIVLFALCTLIPLTVVSSKDGNADSGSQTTTPAAQPRSSTSAAPGTSSPSAITTTTAPPGTATLAPSPGLPWLSYPDPNAEVTHVPQGITAKVRGWVPEDHFVWTGARAIINSGGNRTELPSSLLPTILAGPDVWETEQCFGLGNKPGVRLIVSAYLLPKEAHERWSEDRKKVGFLRKSEYQLKLDGVRTVGEATVELTDETQCIRAP
jgi:hypothetical protein